MLKIKDNVTLKELEAIGFKKKYYMDSIVLEAENHKQDIVFNLKTKNLCFCNWGYDILFDMIKNGLIEKVTSDEENL